MRAIHVWELADFVLKLYPGTTQGERIYLPYRFWDNGWRCPKWTKTGMTFELRKSPLFQGEDFSPSPMDYRPGGAVTNSMIGSLLGFLSLRPGDTDDDYFARYTKVQHEWLELTSRSYLLNIIADSLENGQPLELTKSEGHYRDWEPITWRVK